MFIVSPIWGILFANRRISSKMIIKSAALAAGGYWLNPGPRHTKDAKMVPVDSLLDAQHYKSAKHWEMPV